MYKEFIRRKLVLKRHFARRMRIGSDTGKRSAETLIESQLRDGGCKETTEYLQVQLS